MVASSVLVAVLTSALTVRGMQHATGVSTPERALRAQPVTTIAAAPLPARDSSSILRAMHIRDSATIAAAARSDSVRKRDETSVAVAPSPPAARPLPMPAQFARTPKRIAPRTEHPSASVAEHARTTPPASAISTSIATRTNASAPPATTAPSITAPLAAAPPTPAPAVAASPLANPAVLEELRAIHAEIDARKRHMDSLTASLDSLNHVPKPH
jgi:hypothetical protein